MIALLHPNDNEEQTVYCFITGLAQTIQDEHYLFRITTLHEAMAKA